MSRVDTKSLIFVTKGPICYVLKVATAQRRFRPSVNRRGAGKLGRKESSAKADISSNRVATTAGPTFRALVTHYCARARAVNIPETYVGWPERAELSWGWTSPEPVPLFPVGGRDSNGAAPTTMSLAADQRCPALPRTSHEPKQALIEGCHEPRTWSGRTRCARRA